MAKSFKFPKFKDPFKDPFKLPKEPKIKEMHVVTFYERQIVEILCPAIKAKRMVRFYYSDKDKDYHDWRTIEPHLIGELKTTGNIILSGWYIPTMGQKMNEGEEEKWGNYILGNIDIKTIEVLPEVFRGTRPRYNPNDSRMKVIHCRTL